MTGVSARIFSLAPNMLYISQRLGKSFRGLQIHSHKGRLAESMKLVPFGKGTVLLVPQCSKRIGYVNRLCWGLYMDVSQQEYHNPLLGAYSGGTILLTYTLPRPDIQVKGCLLGT